jgi:hypothetical protein
VTEALEMSWPAERVAVIGAVLSTLERDGLSESQLARDIGAAIADLAAARSDQAEAGGDGGSA